MATDTNLGKWDRVYGLLGKRPQPYADTVTYRMGADWLAGLQVEDWGCGKGWLRTLVTPERYRGIDGSRSVFADEIADLAVYRSCTPGLFMRHVLEHDPRWALILDNALASFTVRMVLVLFTPLGEVTHDMEWEPDPGVPNLSFRLGDLTDRMDAAGVDWQVETLATASKYGVETVIRCQR